MFMVLVIRQVLSYFLTKLLLRFWHVIQKTQVTFLFF